MQGALGWRNAAGASRTTARRCRFISASVCYRCPDTFPCRPSIGCPATRRAGASMEGPSHRRAPPTRMRSAAAADTLPRRTAAPTVSAPSRARSSRSARSCHWLLHSAGRADCCVADCHPASVPQRGRGGAATALRKGSSRRPHAIHGVRLRSLVPCTRAPRYTLARSAVSDKYVDWL